MEATEQLWRVTTVSGHEVLVAARWCSKAVALVKGLTPAAIEQLDDGRKLDNLRPISCREEPKPPVSDIDCVEHLGPVWVMERTAHGDAGDENGQVVVG